MWCQCCLWDEMFTRKKKKKKKKKNHTKWAEGHGVHSVKEPSGWWDKRLLLQAELCPHETFNLISVWFDSLICSTERRNQSTWKLFFIKRIFNFVLSVKHDRDSILQGECSISLNLPNELDFIQEVDTFSQEGNGIMSETTGVLSCLKINMWLSVLLY